MKIFISLLFISATACGQNLTKLDESNGFRNYLFGSAPGSYKDLNIEIDEGASKLFSSTQDTLQYGGVKFEYIRVTFLNDKLYDVSLKTKNAGGAKILEALQKNYGKPALVKGNYEWVGKKVNLLYQKFKGENDAVVSFSSKEIAAQCKKSTK